MRQLSHVLLAALRRRPGTQCTFRIRSFGSGAETLDILLTDETATGRLQGRRDIRTERLDGLMAPDTPLAETLTELAGHLEVCHRAGAPDFVD